MKKMSPFYSKISKLTFMCITFDYLILTYLTVCYMWILYTKNYFLFYLKQLKDGNCIRKLGDM